MATIRSAQVCHPGQPGGLDAKARAGRVGRVAWRLLNVVPNHIARSLSSRLDRRKVTANGTSKLIQALTFLRTVGHELNRRTRSHFDTGALSRLFFSRTARRLRPYPWDRTDGSGVQGAYKPRSFSRFSGVRGKKTGVCD